MKRRPSFLSFSSHREENKYPTFAARHALVDDSIEPLGGPGPSHASVQWVLIIRGSMFYLLREICEGDVPHVVAPYKLLCTKQKKLLVRVRLYMSRETHAT